MPQKPDDGETILHLYERCGDDCCRTTYFRALYLLCGNVTDPAKRYHLDFAFADPDTRDRAAEVFQRAGFLFRTSTRRGIPILYTKNSGEIEDFLTYIGASQAALTVMNAKIVKDFLNETVSNFCIKDGLTTSILLKNGIELRFSCKTSE